VPPRSFAQRSTCGLRLASRSSCSHAGVSFRTLLVPGRPWCGNARRAGWKLMVAIARTPPGWIVLLETLCPRASGRWGDRLRGCLSSHGIWARSRSCEHIASLRSAQISLIQSRANPQTAEARAQGGDLAGNGHRPASQTRGDALRGNALRGNARRGGASSPWASGRGANRQELRLRPKDRSDQQLSPKLLPFPPEPRAVPAAAALERAGLGHRREWVATGHYH
jgi:hypothetical protein